MKNTYLIAAVLAVFLLFGCLGIGGDQAVSSGYPGSDSSSYGTSGAPMKEAAGYSGGDYAPEAPSSQVVDKMLVKTGSAEVEVPANTLKARYDQFVGVVSSFGGEITDSSYTETATEKYYYVTVKVDPAKFDQFGAKLADIGTVKSLSSNSQDVTTQYIDISAKLENLKATRDRVLSLYNRTDNISDILQIEQELNRLQYDIDSTTQQKLYYERQAAKATMSVKLVEPAPVIDRTLFQPFGDLANIFIGALAFGLTLVVGLLGFGIPVAIALGILYLLVKWLFFRKKDEKPAAKK